MRTTDPFAAVLKALETPGRATSDCDLNPATMLPKGRVMRPAAVLVAFEDPGCGLRVILTKRASHLKHHPGQIAFPGGKSDRSDRDTIATALREAEEEIGLSRDKVTVLGMTEPHETVTGFSVTPVLARVSPGFLPKAQAEEVEEIFTVPMAHLAVLANYRIESRHWRGQLRRYYAVPYGPYYIWGATARILRALAERMA